MRKATVAKRDVYLAQNVFGLNIGESYHILNIIEKIIPPFYLTGINAENFLQLKIPNNL